MTSIHKKMFEALMFEINNLIEKKQESRKKNLLLKEFSNSQKKIL